MKHAIYATFGAFAVAGTLTVAHTPTPSSPRPQTPSPSPSTPARTDDKTITVTGCLKAWDASMDTGRGGSTTPPATTAANRFVLSNVTADMSGTAKPATGTATPGRPSPEAGGHSMGARDDTQYVLTADSGVNLSAHLNHQVRVTGKMTEPADRPAPATRPTAPTPTRDPSRPGETPRTGDRMGADKAWSTIAVSSVTMISTSCTGATL
ncbi:MAG: hypothetical protein AB7H93_22870 [Vicinamibacterales bacterium]